jgi:hypothetical protein
MEIHARLIGEDKDQALILQLNDAGFRIVEEDGF